MPLPAETDHFLIISPDGGLTRSLKPVLQRLNRRANVHEVASISEAVELLYQNSMDVAFLDMSKPSTVDLAQIGRLSMEASYLPVVAVVHRGAEGLGNEAIRAGVQDWLPSDALTDDMVTKSVLYSQERHQWREAFRAMSLVDEATGLYNATGFMAVATPLMERVARQSLPSLFVSADVLGLDDIQQKFGPHERQNAVVIGAGILWQAFRRSDIVARLGREYFGVLAMDAAARHFPIMEQRVQEMIDARKDSERWPFDLRIRLGYVQMDKETKSHDAETLMDRARAMARK